MNEQFVDIVSQMRTLIDALKRHNHAYYVLDNPSISDGEYDSLRQKLMALENDYPALKQIDSPLDSVGGTPLPFLIKWHTIYQCCLWAMCLIASK